MTAHSPMPSSHAFDTGTAAEAAADIAIELSNVCKRYAMFTKPEDRLKQMMVPRLQRLVRTAPSRYFREFSAVNDVSLTVRRGETIGIIGRNGSGKSTLLQMIVGTLTPTSGSIKVNGRIAALLELGAGFNPEFTGRENVYVNGAILGFSREEMDERFEAIAAFAGIGEFIERPVKTYSSGMFVRLAFAVSTAVEPDILVVDEALSVGDEAFQRKCFARIEAIKERGGTILFVSHGAQTIVQLCDRAVLMDAGEKILEGEPKLVVGQYQRLVNLPQIENYAVREEIKNSFALGVVSDIAKVISEITSQTPAVDNKEKDITISALESFDTHLLAITTITFENNGAHISNLRISNESDQSVNILERGFQYTFSYVVTFLKDASDVRFGMLLNTITGLAISGFGSEMKIEDTINFKAGQKALVRMKFVCRLGQGTYLFNCGVGGVSLHEREMLHRVIDGILFKVVEQKTEFSSYFDLSVETEISLEASPNF